MADENTFYHALVIDDEKCIRCTHCVKICPTEAIRIVKGKVQIREEQCVDCGECVRACPQNAIGIDHDDIEKIHDYEYRVLLLPSVFLSQFPDTFSEDLIYTALLEIGFTHVYEVEQPIGIMKNLIRNEIKKNQTAHPVISSFCPAIVRLIQVHYPSLTQSIARLKAPHDLAAHYVLDQLQSENIEISKAGLFYVTPCVAKITAVKSPVGELKSIIDGVISPKELYNKVLAKTNHLKAKNCSHLRKNLTKEGIQWSLTHGETWWQNTRTMAVDGIHNSIKFLERIENDEIENIDYIELRACDRSCAAGVLLPQNRFVTVEKIKHRAKLYPSEEKRSQIENENLYEQLKPKMITDEIPPRPLLRFGSDMEKALSRMQRARNIMCHLPAIDCAACGAPTCQALAEDMANQKAKMSDCIFIQQLWQKNNKVSPQKAFDRMEKKWGEKRFDPDCSKIGTKNETSN